MSFHLHISTDFSAFRIHYKKDISSRNKYTKFMFQVLEQTLVKIVFIIEGLHVFCGTNLLYKCTTLDKNCIK